MNIGWPQGIYLALVFLMLCVTSSKNGQPRTSKYDLGASLFGAGCVISLLYWGGFFS